MAQGQALTAREEWKAGWKLVMATFFGFSLLAVMTNSISMFMGPLSEEFGWSRTLISSGFTVAAVVTAVLSPAIGALIDRFGSRLVGLPGIVGTALCVAAFSLANGSETQWFALWLLYAVIAMAVKPAVWTAPVVSEFTAARGLAIGITLSGVAVTQAVLPPLANVLINEFGWRTAYALLGLGWGGVVLLLCWLFLFDAHDRRKAAARAGGTAVAERPDFPGLTIQQAWRSSALWRIALSTLLVMFLTIGLTLHQIEILGEAGVSRTNAALLASVAAVAGIVGKLVTGVLLDKFRPNWVGGLTLAGTAIAFALLIQGIASPVLIFVAMIVNGYTQGCKLQINGYLTARYAGMRNFGAIYGFMNTVIALGSGLGPVVAGLAYDQTGTYTAFLILGAIGCLIGGLLIMTLPAYPDWEARAADDEGGNPQGALA